MHLALEANLRLHGDLHGVLAKSLSDLLLLPFLTELALKSLCLRLSLIQLLLVEGPHQCHLSLGSFNLIIESGFLVNSKGKCLPRISNLLPSEI